MIPSNTTGKRIKKIRKKMNITQEELSARLITQGINVDRPMISKIENQTREVLDYEIEGIAKALGVAIQDLFNS